MQPETRKTLSTCCFDAAFLELALSLRLLQISFTFSMLSLCKAALLLFVISSVAQALPSAELNVGKLASDSQVQQTQTLSLKTCSI
jgi:hypothetical protein